MLSACICCHTCAPLCLTVSRARGLISLLCACPADPLRTLSNVQGAVEQLQRWYCTVQRSVHDAGHVIFKTLELSQLQM